MKKLTKWMCLMVLGFALITTSSINKVAAQPGVSVSFSVFYSNLAPYGQWVTDPGYGNVWVPNVEVGFRPYYSDGYWVMTDYGNTWVSNYPWGWAPFHYGRWIYDEYYGWVWVPDDVWGPAWVDWRYGGGVYGWAPLAPGISVGFALGGGYYCPDDWWIFVPQARIYSTDVYRYYYGPRYSPSYVRSTTIINNTYVRGGATYVSGPRAQEVQRVTGQPVRTYSVREMNSPGGTSVGNGAVAMYRPRVSASAGGRSVAPTNAVRAERPVGKPQSVSTNGGRPLRLTNPSGGAAGETKSAQPEQHNASPRIQQQQPATREQNQPTNREQPRQMERAQPKQTQPQQPMRQEQPRQQPSQINREQPKQMERAQPKREQPQQPAKPQQQPPQMNREQPKQMDRAQPQHQQPRQIERAPQPRQQMPQPRMEPRPMPQPREAPSPHEEREHGPKLR